jgi:hypothetical protein
VHSNQHTTSDNLVQRGGGGLLRIHQHHQLTGTSTDGFTGRDRASVGVAAWQPLAQQRARRSAV